MRVLPISMAVLLTCLVCVRAGEKDSGFVWKCYSGDGDGGNLDYFTAQAVPPETFSTYCPDEIYKPNPTNKALLGTPLKLLWKKLDEGMTVNSSLVTTYRGHDIYCFIYKSKPEQGDPEAAFDLAVVAYQVNTGKAHAMFRPFFILNGDQVRDFAASLEPLGKQPAIRIWEEMEGNGLYNTTWIAILTDSGPRFVESIDNGRKVPERTSYYDSNGKVIKVKEEKRGDE